MRCVIVHSNRFFCGANQFDYGPRAWTYRLDEANVYEHNMVNSIAQYLEAVLPGHVHINSEAELRFDAMKQNDSYILYGLCGIQKVNRRPAELSDGSQ